MTLVGGEQSEGAAPTELADAVVQQQSTETVGNENLDNDDQDNLAPDTEDVEYEGKQYKLPKELKDALLRQSDYTKKSQTVSESKRTLEEREKSFSEQARLHQEHLSDVGRVYAINEKVQQWEKAFKEPGWAQFEQANPGQAQALFRQYLLDKDALRDAAGGLQQKITQRSQEAQRESAKRVEEAHAAVARDVKDWPALRDKAVDFGVTQLGFRAEEIKALDDPRLLKALHRAYAGEQAIRKLAALEKAQNTEQAQPLKTVGSNSGATQRRTTDASGDKLSTEEWMKRETERTAKLNKRK